MLLSLLLISAASGAMMPQIAMQQPQVQQMLMPPQNLYQPIPQQQLSLSQQGPPPVGMPSPTIQRPSNKVTDLTTYPSRDGRYIEVEIQDVNDAKSKPQLLRVPLPHVSEGPTNNCLTKRQIKRVVKRAIRKELQRLVVAAPRPKRYILAPHRLPRHHKEEEYSADGGEYDERPRYVLI